MRRWSPFSQSAPQKARVLQLALGLGLLSSVATPSAWALPTQLRPGWAKSSQICESPNDSFLMERSRSTRTEDAEVRDRLFDPKLALQMRQEYEDSVRNYEMRERHDLVSIDEQRAHASWMSDFTKNVMNQVKNFHFQSNMKKVRTAVEKNEVVQVLKAPVGVVAGVVAIGTGEPINVKMSEKTRFTSRTDVRSRKGQFTLTSPLLNSSLDVASAAPSDRDPYAPPPVDPTQQDERYKLSVSRGLPIWDLSSGVSYGTTTSTVSASLSKHIFDNLTCVVDTSRTTKQSSSNIVSGQETVRFLYGMNF